MNAFTAVLAPISFALTTHAAAGSFPDPTTVIVLFAAGGASDAAALRVVRKLTAHHGPGPLAISSNKGVAPWPDLPTTEVAGFPDSPRAVCLSVLTARLNADLAT
jgi:hypothetical protein